MVDAELALCTADMDLMITFMSILNVDCCGSVITYHSAVITYCGIVPYDV